MPVSENVYTAELMRFPGPWGFQIGHAGIILVTDAELEIISDHPDQPMDLSVTFDKRVASLRQVCEEAQAAGQRTLMIAFDHFFQQYRPGQDSPRRLTPDSAEYVERIARVSQLAAQYGLGLELSLLSPLEIGPAYEKATGESGVWMHYRKGRRDARTGAYSVNLWRQKRWANNKGVIEPRDAGVRVFAFSEKPVPGTSYRSVAPESIVEISETAKIELLSDGEVRAQIRVHGTGGPAGHDRVLVVQNYKTPEMDYFSGNALPYLTDLVDRYADAGVKLHGLYSDEMHIQQDWDYFHHHDHGQFALRYVSPGLAQEFAKRYGVQYADFARYLVYFCSGQEDAAFDLSATENVSHVLGDTPEAIRETALLRSRYYALLQNGVVELFTQAKRHAEDRMNQQLMTRAHATWAESPTIDYWRTGPTPLYQSAYEYTPDFVWSNTVHQAASACHDYFKWGEFLTGSGNDHCECGYADRNYVGIALAASIGVLNEIPYAYAAHWGLPNELSRRRYGIVNASGSAGSPLYGMAQQMQHRDVDVLMLYPLDLVATDERFGSWMTQYAYANYISPAKLLEMGRVENGAIVVNDRKFTTLIALFEPLPDPKLLPMMRQLAESGGRVIWSGPPPLLANNGQKIRADWEQLFGVTAPVTTHDGLPAPGRVVTFAGLLESLAPQTILTDFLVDHIYPVTTQGDAVAVATLKNQTVGAHRKLSGGGSTTFLGFRPRDDQSKSLGYESRTWFETLHRLGAYPGADCPEVIARTTDYFACRFPNGAVGIAPHFRETEENWEGGFARDPEKDADYLRRFPPPSEAIALQNLRVAGHMVTFTGRHALTFRTKNNTLLAFAGCGCQSISVDGVETVFADREMDEVAWAPIPGECRTPGGAVLKIMARTPGTLTIPVEATGPLVVVAEGHTPGSRGETVTSRKDGARLIVTVGESQINRYLYAVSAS